MTVKELIDKLSSLDQNYEVLFRDHDGWYYDVGVVRTKKMNIDAGRQQTDTDDMPVYLILNG